MRTKAFTLMCIFTFAVALSLVQVSAARADGPVIGTDVGAAIPLDKYKRTVDKDVGLTAGFWGGYRFDLSDEVALSLLAQPQFSFFKTQEGCCRGKNDEEDASLFAITGGPELSFWAGIVETYVGAQAGYYRDMSGPMSDDGFGFNAGGGLRFEVVRDTTVGLFGRYDYMNLVAAPGSDVQRQMVLAGFTFQRVFQPPSPPPRRAEAPPPPPAPRAARKIILRGVNFDFDKATIRADARPVLDEAIRTLEEERDVDVAVEGHTDAIGSDAYNQRLSERRAHAVADHLARGGVARSRMTVSGFGESRPVASNATDDGRAQNRRVELHVAGQ
jgi:outer membrane protein OmpA-like peptidoglycan-associated protein